MGPEGWFTLAVILIALVLLLAEWMAPDLLLLAALGVVTAGGVVELEVALSGFADPTILAIGSLFVVAQGLRCTGVLRKAAHLLLGGFEHIRPVLTRLTVATAVSSAFLNNTPIVAMGIPAVLSWARDRAIQASKLLIPLSYASILGGVCTLIGTSTNLVADGLLRAEGMAGLGFFELGRVGVPLAIVGIAYLVFLAPGLLPDRMDLRTRPTARGTVAEDIHLYRVPADSIAVGRTVADAALNTPELQLVRVVREAGAVAPVKPDTGLRAGDRLTFRGSVHAMDETAQRLGLEPQQVSVHPELEGPVSLREVVIPEASVLAGERLDHVDFHDRYGVTVLGVVRGGRQLEDVSELVIRPGDTLFLVARASFGRTQAEGRDFHLIGGEEMESEELSDTPLWRPTQAKAGLAILVAVVGFAATGVVHISLAALGGAVAMTALGFVSPAEARRSVDWSVLVVIGAAIGLGAALSESGAAQMIARGVVALGEPLGTRGILGAVVLGTMLFTLLITNNAAVAILFPVVVSVAGSQGLDPRPFVIAVTVSASLAFATPLGYQTNLMVYGAGGYRFTDFVRAGLPLQLLMAVVSVLVIPILWPM